MSGERRCSFCGGKIWKYDDVWWVINTVTKKQEEMCQDCYANVKRGPMYKKIRILRED